MVENRWQTEQRRKRILGPKAPDDEARGGARTFHSDAMDTTKFQIAQEKSDRQQKVDDEIKKAKDEKATKEGHPPTGYESLEGLV